MDSNIINNSDILAAVVRTLPGPIFIIDEQRTYIEIMGGMERSLNDSPGYLKRRKLNDVLMKWMRINLSQQLKRSFIRILLSSLNTS